MLPIHRLLDELPEGTDLAAALAPHFELRPVTVDRFTPAAVVVLEGLGAGDIVVTAGVQALRPGQTVRLMGASS